MSSNNNPKLGIAIFDIDGCVSDDRHRTNLIVDSNGLGPSIKYARYHAAAKLDKPLEHGVNILQKFVGNNTLIAFVTARPISLSQPTVDWIQRELGLLNGVDFVLFMRPSGNLMTSPELKTVLAGEVLSMAERHGTSVIAAFDDRQDVIEVYRAMGISAYILNADGTDAPAIRQYTPEELDKLSKGEKLPEPTVAWDPAAVGEDETVVATVQPEDPSGDDPASASASVFFPEGRTTGMALRGAADLFDSRNANYKDNAYIVGKVMAALFPEGVTIKSADDHHMYHLTELMVVKLTRFATSGLTHADSIRDLIAYAGMVETRHETHSIEVH